MRNHDFPRESIEGYGFSRYNISKYGDPGGVTNLDHAIAIGIPLVGTDPVVELQFKIGSGVKLGVNDLQYRFYEPFRLDCDCEFYDDCVTEILVGTGTAPLQSIASGFGRFGFGRLNFGGAISITPTPPPVPTAPRIVRCSDQFFQNSFVNTSSPDTDHSI